MPSDTGSREDDAPLLDVLGDDLSRSILIGGTDDVVTASELADAFGVSVTTVYRRLNKLEALGLIREVSDVRESPSSETGYRTDFGATVVGLSPDGFRTTEGDTDLAVALSILLDHVDVRDALFSFETGEVTVTLSADEETIATLQTEYREATDTESYLETPNRSS